jgi:hypothetical protein
MIMKPAVPVTEAVSMNCLLLIFLSESFIIGDSPISLTFKIVSVAPPPIAELLTTPRGQ